MALPPFVDFQEVLQATGLDEEASKRLVEEGEIRAFREKDRMVFPAEEVSRLIETLQAATASGTTTPASGSTQRITEEPHPRERAAREPDGQTKASSESDAAEAATQRTPSTERPFSDAVPLHLDQPADRDLLGRKVFAEALARHASRIWQQGGNHAFALHVHGPWGSGKSSLLNLIRRELQGTEDANSLRIVVSAAGGDASASWRARRRVAP